MNDRQVKLVIGCLLSDKRLPDIDISNDIFNIVNDSKQIANTINGKIESVNHSSCKTIFNILNGNSDNMCYPLKTLTEKPVYPQEAVSKNIDSLSIIEDITRLISTEGYTNRLIDALLSLYEEKLSFVPSATNDIPLYDHLKLTAAIGLCIDNKNSDNKLALEDKDFLIYSIDISGIQNFIYNISSKGELKGLRTRSFYLEMLFEVYIDLMLERLSLCRVNVLYLGGGHVYMLLPNSEKIISETDKMLSEINNYCRDLFGNSLYAAAGYAKCSVNDLQNTPEGSYNQIFANISEMISKNKLSRYTSDNIRSLNNANVKDHKRECTICHRFVEISDDKRICKTCAAFLRLSNSILSPDTIFAVRNIETPEHQLEKESKDKLKLPFDKELTTLTKEQAVQLIKSNPGTLLYSKNRKFAKIGIYRNIYLGNYVSQADFKGLINKTKGIKRLAVLRADVDNLGQSFVNGFSQTNGGKYETISRTSVFSRKLSEFFKYHINYILKHGKYSLFENSEDYISRNAVVVYTGGDDLFIIGGWDDIIGFSVDLKNSLKRYTQGTLTLSAGIGIYPEKYPISAMATETGSLEAISKRYNDGQKNAVTLFDKNNTFNWDEFEDKVLGEKLKELKSFLKNSSDHGTSMLYKMLDLIRDRSENGRLNVARFAYLLARNCPEKKGEERDRYIDFERKMYAWIQSETDRKQLVTAIYIYVYMNRGDDTNDQ